MARTDYYGIQTPVLQATSQAIRTVNGTVGDIAPEDYPDLISAMHSSADYDNVMAQLVEETTTPAAIASFTDGANNLPVKELVCTINPTETGSGAKSPSNPYVIGGHTELNLYQRGSNLWDEQWEVGSYATSNGQPMAVTDRIRSKNYIPVSQSTEYRSRSPEQITVFFYDKEKNYLSYTYVTAGRTFTTTTKPYFIRFATSNAYGTTYNNNISINYPSTDTTYHAYNGNGKTHHADFGQTVYGGGFVAKEGEFDKVRITHGFRTFNGSENWGKTAAGPYYLEITDYNKASRITCVSSRFEAMANVAGASIIENNKCCFYKQADQNRFYIRYDDAATTADFQTWLSNNNVQLAYELATPTEIILPTKTEINTLLGANNLYHDCNGNTEVTYRANGALYVAQH